MYQNWSEWPSSDILLCWYIFLPQQTKPANAHTWLIKFNAENFYEALHESMLIFFHQNNAINSYIFNVIFNHFIKIVKTTIDNYAPLQNTCSETTQTKT